MEIQFCKNGRWKFHFVVSLKNKINRMREMEVLCMQIYHMHAHKVKEAEIKTFTLVAAPTKLVDKIFIFDSLNDPGLKSLIFQSKQSKRTNK